MTLLFVRGLFNSELNAVYRNGDSISLSSRLYLYLCVCALCVLLPDVTYAV